MDKVFQIFPFNQEDAKRVNSVTNEPHSHDYEELIIGMEGSLEHYIDFKTTVVDSPFVSFIAKGKIHKVVPGLTDGKCAMWVIRFQSEFIPETTFQLYAHYHDHATIGLQAGACYQRLISMCEMMHAEWNHPEPELAIISHLLSALFIMIEAERKKILTVNNTFGKTQNITFRNFLKILEENFRRPAGVEFYAEKLFMSARNLNLICKNILNQSVSEIIETRKMTEAKNLLAHSHKTVSEIGYELGYQDKSYFTNVFKRKSGQTPTEFRAEMRKKLS